MTSIPSLLLFRGESSPWIRLAVGACSLGGGIAAFVWPRLTVQVVGFLFGLNLFVIGTVRTALLVFLSGYPVLYRIAGIGFGVLTAIAGVTCMYHRAASVVLLLFVGAFSWVSAGAIELFLPAAGNGSGAGAGWWIGTGLLGMLAVGALLWSQRGFSTLVALGAAVLIIVGIRQVIKAVIGLCQGHGTQTLLDTDRDSTQVRHPGRIGPGVP